MLTGKEKLKNLLMDIRGLYAHNSNVTIEAMNSLQHYDEK